MAALSEGELLKTCEAKSISDIERLSAVAKGLTSVCSLKKASKLHRIDLSKNQLHSLKFAGKCSSLTWLNVSENCITTLIPLTELVNLQVLNVSRNELTSLDGIDKLTDLKALILNNNKLESLPSMNALEKLNTLILSYNLLTSFDSSGLPLLEKLQLSHNKLREFPDVKGNRMLKILSLNENAISKVAQGAVSQANQRLEIVELGRNNIQKLRSIKELHVLPSLKRLNLAGNPVTMKENYATKVKIICPYLSNLDGRPISVLSSKVSNENMSGNVKMNPRKTDVELDEKPSVESGESTFTKKNVNKKSKQPSAKGAFAEMADATSGDSAPTKKKKLSRTEESELSVADDVEPGADDSTASEKKKKRKTSSEESGSKKKKKQKHQPPSVAGESVASHAAADSGVIAVKVIKNRKRDTVTATQLSLLDHVDLGCGGGMESW